MSYGGGTDESAKFANNPSSCRWTAAFNVDDGTGEAIVHAEDAVVIKLLRLAPSAAHNMALVARTQSLRGMPRLSYNPKTPIDCAPKGIQETFRVFRNFSGLDGELAIRCYCFGKDQSMSQDDVRLKCKLQAVEVARIDPRRRAWAMLERLERARAQDDGT